MFEISTVFEGEKRRVNLHEVRVPGVNVKATELTGPDLYRAMVKLRVPEITANMGWQDLAFRSWRLDSAAGRGTEASSEGGGLTNEQKRHEGRPWRGKVRARTARSGYEPGCDSLPWKESYNAA